MKWAISPVKLNAVIMRGVNEDEIEDLARLTFRFPFHVRFIEIMPFRQEDYDSIGSVSSSEILDKKSGFLFRERTTKEPSHPVREQRTAISAGVNTGPESRHRPGGIWPRKTSSRPTFPALEEERKQGGWTGSLRVCSREVEVVKSQVAKTPRKDPRPPVRGNGDHGEFPPIPKGSRYYQNFPHKIKKCQGLIQSINE